MAIVPDLSGNTPHNAPFKDPHLVHNSNVMSPMETSVVTLAPGGVAVSTEAMRDVFGDPYSGVVEIMAVVPIFIAIGPPGTVATSSNKPLPASVIQIMSIPAEYVLSVIENGVIGGEVYVTQLQKVFV